MGNSKNNRKKLLFQNSVSVSPNRTENRGYGIVAVRTGLKDNEDTRHAKVVPRKLNGVSLSHKRITAFCLAEQCYDRACVLNHLTFQCVSQNSP